MSLLTQWHLEVIASSNHILLFLEFGCTCGRELYKNRLQCSAEYFYGGERFFSSPREQEQGTEGPFPHLPPSSPILIRMGDEPTKHDN